MQATPNTSAASLSTELLNASLTSTSILETRLRGTSCRRIQHPPTMSLLASTDRMLPYWSRTNWAGCWAPRRHGEIWLNRTFETWARSPDGTPLPPLNRDVVLSCWDMLLCAGVRSGALKHADVRRIYEWFPQIIPRRCRMTRSRRLMRLLDGKNASKQCLRLMDCNLSHRVMGISVDSRGVETWLFGPRRRPGWPMCRVRLNTDPLVPGEC